MPSEGRASSRRRTSPPSLNWGRQTTGFQSGATLGLDTTNALNGSFNQNQVISNPNSGTNVLNVTKLGAGTLILSANNTYTGTTTVAAGMLQFSKPGALYSGNTALWTASKIVVDSGATLAVNYGGSTDFTSAQVATLAGLGTATGGFLRGSTLGLDTTNVVGGNAIYNGFIGNPNAGTNTLTLAKLGTNTLTLLKNNTYSGGTVISDGTLAVSTISSVGTAQPLGIGKNITLTGASAAAPGALDYTGNGATLAQNITVSTGDYGMVANTGIGTLTLSGSISKNGSVLTLAGHAITVTGSITGSAANSDLNIGSTAYLGRTSVTLSGTNFYNGPTIITEGSTLLTSVNGALPVATPTAVTLGASTDAPFQVNTLDLEGTSQTVSSLTAMGSATNQIISSDGGGTSPSTGTGTITVVYSGTGTNTFTGSLGQATGARLASNFGLILGGTGTVALTAANTYTGGTSVASGGLVLANGTNGSATGSGALTVASGATIGGAGTSQSTSFTINGNVEVGNGIDATSQTQLLGSSASSFSSANLAFNLGTGASLGESNTLSLGATPITFTNTLLTFQSPRRGRHYARVPAIRSSRQAVSLIPPRTG